MVDTESSERIPEAAIRPERYGVNGKPYLRWWWFASKIRDGDIDRQIAWISANGFGGVELAFVYSSNDACEVDPFLGPAWQAAVTHCARACRRAGIGFDVTFGTLWPFGGSMVGREDALLTFTGLSDQRLGRSWESGEGKEPGYIINHLDRGAFERYAATVAPTVRPALEAYAGGDEPPSPPCLFCDSWEVHVEGLWTAGLADLFESEYGYRVESYMKRLDDEPEVRYDYRRLVSRLILDEFLRPFAETCRANGALSRVQCHGAPTDLVAAYAAVDVPESETLLFDPPFSAIAASAAAQAGAPVVSCESFTCLYGWERWPGPGPHQGEEYWPDIRLTADAMFANGVNHVVWHGMPYSSAGGRERFYATVHVAPDAAFAEELPALNAYFAEVCKLMQEGVTYAPLAVYQPLEDLFCMGELSEDDKRPSASYHWEMQYLDFPEETRAYRPIWTSEHFLRSAGVDADGSIRLGAHRVEAIYVASRYLDLESLTHLVRLLREGATVVLTSEPAAPGRRLRLEYPTLLEELHGLAVGSLGKVSPGKVVPVVTGDGTPPYWARELCDATDRSPRALRVFFAHPVAAAIRYPLQYRSSDRAAAEAWSGALHWRGISADVDLQFGAGEGLLVELSAAGEITVRHGNDMLAGCGLDWCSGPAEQAEAPQRRTQWNQ